MIPIISLTCQRYIKSVLDVRHFYIVGAINRNNTMSKIKLAKGPT